MAPQPVALGDGSVVGFIGVKPRELTGIKRQPGLPALRVLAPVVAPRPKQ